ncbi:efflux RND transporter periplasmic adaptor subunit [Fulvimarina sp. 2208YS6-2-32]|uniref:Efflux RND transporter periplasmic adaptor subunit n=1 Tax=Fulvimarina uroteuthidis TaxID=3098149 RepID=A0ABU5HZJ2_9HYPH|nr:efflux RND transporter periplasmic adaptor subunit [Fulvimarina sp. 2208YS6-2-32]MDY8108541.1 efflux RND transporter periplasmic adaptor subunit [Fulvimarina sp. 2208YS6-2-32]
MHDFKTALVAIAALGTLVHGPAFAQGGGTPPPPGVTVQTVVAQDLPVTYDYAGRVAASREVQVRARVGGILLERDFEEGSRVKVGDLLFRIDPATYEAQVALARAQVLEAQAGLSQAQRSEERARTLAQRGASSQANLDDAISARQLAEAQVAAAEAQLRTANLSLEYATVRAPVSGITSLEQVPEGSLLSSGDLLTRIDQLDPINVNFSAADTEAASIRELLDEGRLEGADEASDLTVTIRFGDGSTYDKTGRIDFTSTTIDTQTGTILSRAVLPNPDRRLLPGQFVRLQVEGLSVEDAITIPTEALMQGPQGTFVYTVGDDNLAEVKPVTVARELDGMILISEGLDVGDKVVTEGVVKVRPGAPVDPQPSGTPPAEAEDRGEGSEDGEAGPGGTSSQSDGADRAATALASEATAEATRPPVPRTALPDGQAARKAQNNVEPERTGSNERAELIR